VTVEADIAAEITTNLGVGFTLGGNVRTGPVRKPTDDQTITGAVPHKCIFCLGTGGIDDVPFIDGGAKGAEQRLTVQVWVRSNPKDYDGGKALADSVFLAIDKNPPTGYHEARALASAPIYVRQDDTDHHEWSINVLARRCV
jgi:hypothetical protein